MRSQTLTQIFAADTFVKPDLDVWNNNVHTIGGIAGCMFDAVNRAKTYTGLAASTIVRNNDRNFLRLFLLPRDFPGASGMIIVGLPFFTS